MLLALAGIILFTVMVKRYKIKYQQELDVVDGDSEIPTIKMGVHTMVTCHYHCCFIASLLLALYHF